MIFAGKVVLIVGASSGMGRGVARRLAAEGATIVATARRAGELKSLAAEIALDRGVCMIHPADALREDEAAAVVEATIARFGRIDLLLMNVGGAPDLDLRTIGVGAVKDYMRSNYDVCVNYLFPVLHQMMRQGSGMVAHTNSLAGLMGVPLQGPYSAAKGAMRLLMDTCRVEFADHGIRFVSIYPGFVATARTQAHAMPSPFEISEQRGVAHIVRALRTERSDYRFPAAISWLVRVATVLPQPIVTMLLRWRLRAART
ncbi:MULTISPECIES: SDR family NAD(P)-dependent oxidoreductase [unclassified Sphingomonas]|uniref:SDR family NAD(P)-dependent oxidoreductase n=1 Tax=unclassified Sphingomonas TaxID=196159 RepID=UPI0006FDCFF4|nr:MULTISPECIES: SDR family NAD(P)-dependent oxidoreductase [unclassified Sphingomonas]KQS46987.1 short-chain dehydrogenase [Sphingomonas sp. Leaf198]